MSRGLRADAMARRAEFSARYGAAVSPSLPRQLSRYLLPAVLLALLAAGLWRVDFSPERIWNGLGKLGFILSFMVPPHPGNLLGLFIRSLGETVAIAFLGTLLGAIMALPLGVLAARNVIPSWIFRFSMRRGLDVLRGVDTLIWALIFINVVGLGPFAGILAIMVSDIGSFGKLYSEAIEASDKKPVEGIRAAGGSELHALWYGVLPQVFPVMVSQVLYFFESNTRSATIIGIVGAGGIGLHLADQIRLNEWQTVAFIVLMILVTVGIIDFCSTRLRFALIGKGRLSG